jgi:7-carboxy-7-deazaguanine synthase
MSEPSLVVSEVFGPTVQGEGPSAGRRCSFIRTMGCNLACSWCDTPYTWDASRFDLRAEGHRTPVRDVVAAALTGSPGLVVISGGEPLLHQSQPGWDALLAALLDAGVDMEVETNGTVQPTQRTLTAITRFNVSPKLPHSGDAESARIVPAVLAAFAGLAATDRACFKFVVTKPADIDLVAALCDTHRLPRSQVWIMPEGTNVDRLTGWFGPMIETAVGHGFNATTRLHVLAWGQERKR